jgi:GNAT superfamily N-acetyltransferase
MDLPPSKLVTSRVPDLVFEEASTADVVRRPRRHASYGTDTDTRLARGDRCVVGLRDGDIVYHNWISFDADLIARRCPGIGRIAGTAYAYDGYTAPEWRGLSIQPAALSWIGRWATDRASRLLLSIEPDNVRSVRAAEKAGFRILSGDMSKERT